MHLTTSCIGWSKLACLAMHGWNVQMPIRWVVECSLWQNTVLHKHTAEGCFQEMLHSAQQGDQEWEVG